ncbi:MAG: HAMP domain-containing protein, partial [Candidatus Vogelbacteria bacterium]|nr:HAMP domain-containing protein [Candidatus Vogelbacteria bacterium]
SRFLGEEVILKQKVETENARDCFDPEEIEYVKKNGYGGVAGIESHAHIIEAKDYRGVDITGTHAYIPETGWCLITKVDTSDLLAYRYNLLLFILGVFLIAGLILFFFGYFLAERITWPLNRLSLVAEKIKQGDLDVRADIKTDDEIGDLANSFNFMVEAVHESQSSIEQKVEDQTKDLNTKAKELADQQKRSNLGQYWGWVNCY